MNDATTKEQRRVTRVARIRAFIFCLNRSRFSVLILIVGFLLLSSGQGQDLLIAYAEQGTCSTVRLILAAGLWALSIWAWCRILLDIKYDEPPSCIPCYNFWRRWMPRILGSMAFFAVALAAHESELRVLEYAALIALALFLGLVIGRRHVSNRASSLLGQVAEERRAAHRFAGRAAQFLRVAYIERDSTPPYGTLRDALRIPQHRFFSVTAWGFGGLVTLAMVAAFILLFLAGTFTPVQLGNKSGAMIVFFLWATTWLPVGSSMSYVADRHGWPLLTILAVLALISSFFNDNHEIRVAHDGVPVSGRPSVSDALSKWVAANRLSTKEARPFVVVATAGGGIRAAYWTVTVLGELDGKAAEFRKKLFAISGVSGGSVGATIYRGLIGVGPAQLKTTCGSVLTCGQTILGQDFLGPLTAAMLYPDLLQRFLPFPFLPDRGTALERSWESAFRKATGEDILASSLVQLSRAQPWPALFLNATWSEAGRRIVASNLRMSREDKTEAAAFVLATDELDKLGYDIRLSTAAHNSARFPFVSPPGMWRDKRGDIAGRLQDGGLFENYGAETALEILDLACHKLLCVPAPVPQQKAGGGAKCDRPCIYPVVILITSDPTLPKSLAQPSPAPTLRFAYEIRSTLNTYERARTGHGAEAASRLKEWVNAAHGAFVAFRMCNAQTAGVTPPLGWALSGAAKDRIESYLFGPKSGEGAAPMCFLTNARAAGAIENLLSTALPAVSGRPYRPAAGSDPTAD